MRKRILIGAIAIACLNVIALQSQFAAGQGSGSSRSTPSRPARPQTTQEFADALWRFIVRPLSPYTTWAAVPVKKFDQTLDIARAHGASPKIYANPTAMQDPSFPPVGSIFVIDDYADDGKTRNSVSIMYRVKGTDPEHNDWYWLRYLPNGSIARTDSAPGAKPIAGKVKSCIDCHGKAAGKDLVFSNDPTE
jgi:hypothetical protein